ncbi:MAG: 50S ribosomal protein L15 [Candidatus Omnitrophica bacterium CG11_big_fil_rev_8_21_14_0_20_45_26]|uniref:Large ribosomal subunit protein uL15 n=1 Tax=Candidatus Abzuiibacterium crystallinum TaxID=1974748 RepID=A0A2H0LN65_9BACT|nr:MAG: 50S ribosomal protein L15 [Candidatus Omnitrophica bacterium CG11_big_fil_rev_8_21_14_0_20_45_26]PIW65092.1 MAG: 50S ribosomal protein L15 [Candidatus Omnitrophica bacterium CG12_big_fil_rev_8_21_14_0_65_45_16]
MKARKPYHKRAKRIGRGSGSGHGKTATKGMKGQRSRSGFHQRAGFEGGQNPFYRRVPKRGFNQAERNSFAIINLDQLAQLEANEVTPEILLQHGMVKHLLNGLKVLGRGQLNRAVTVKAHRFSASAKTAIEKAGGKAVLIEQAARRQTQN